MVTGDLVEWNTETQYRVFTSLISKFNENNINIYVVPGNHDRRGTDFLLPNPFFPSDDLTNYGKFIGDGNKYDMRDNYFNQDTYRFIGIDSGSDTGLLKSIMHLDLDELNNFLTCPNGSGLTDDQMKYINKTIIGGKTIIFMHHPAIDDSCKNDPCKVINLNRDLFIAAAKEKHVNLVLSGHTHETKFFNADGKQVPPDGLDSVRPLFVQTSSATKYLPLEYLVVDADENGEHIEQRQIVESEMNYTLAFLGSPADLHIYDESGRHTGMTATSGVENNIPDSYYIDETNIGNITIPAFVLLFNNTLNYSFEIVSNFSKENITTPQSSFNFTIINKTSKDITTINYNNVSINSDSRAHLQMNTTHTDYPLQIDLNNDGAPEVTESPDSIITDYAPTAIISSPANDSTWDQDEPISFNGTGIDAEDGALTELTWISDKDGIIGHGNFTTSNLSAGVHNITLLVNDSPGQINTSKIILTVVDTKPPSLDIDFPPENKIFNRQSIPVNGIAYDDSGVLNVAVNGIIAGKGNWNTVVSLNEGKNVIEIVATDNKGFSTTYNRTVYYNSSLASDINPPAAITNLMHKTGHDTASRAWINWTWDNPKDEDFSHVIIYIDGIRMENTSRSYFSLGGLSNDADYSIRILSSDIVDNINYTEAGETVKTPPPDTTPPTTDITLSGKHGDNDWYLSDVQVSLKASDDELGTGVAKIEYSFDGMNWITYNTPFTISKEGTTTIEYNSTDNAGNIESTKTQTVKIDKNPSQITINTPVDGSEYILNQPLTADWSVSDAISGITSATGTYPNGNAINMASVGTQTFGVDATDKAGNTNIKKVMYYIRYKYSGILQPINPDGSSIFKLGSTLPVKFQLWDAGGNFVTNAVAKIYVAKISDRIIGAEMEANSTSNATTGNLFRYYSTSNQYIFNLGTKTLSTGTWQIRIELDDGTSKTATIGLK